MQRDMELVRKILLAVEAKPISADGRSLDDLKIEHGGKRMSGTNQILLEHALMLLDFGLIDAQAKSPMGRLPSGVLIHRLTWAGHEFLDAARSDTVFRAVQDKAKKVGS